MHFGKRHVEEECVRASVLEISVALLARVCLEDLVTRLLERLLVERGQVFLVFDDDDTVLAHTRNSPPRPEPAAFSDLRFGALHCMLRATGTVNHE
jgi:hypothetical protein